MDSTGDENGRSLLVCDNKTRSDAGPGAHIYLDHHTTYTKGKIAVVNISLIFR